MRGYDGWARALIRLSREALSTMSTIVTDCPRCGATMMTFDINGFPVFIETEWPTECETTSVCRRCYRPTIFQLSQTNASITYAELARRFTADEQPYHPPRGKSARSLQTLAVPLQSPCQIHASLAMWMFAWGQRALTLLLWIWFSLTEALMCSFSTD